MFATSFKFSKNTSFGNENSSISPVSSTACSLGELESRIAVRFFVKKSKRFDFLKQQMQRRLQQTKTAVKTKPLPECLAYLGFSPNSMKTRDRDERKRENRTDFQFQKPRIYECCYCTKIFFHKLPFRRHMIRHMKKIHWCMKCSRGFTTKISKKRHELSCQR